MSLRSSFNQDEMSVGVTIGLPRVVKKRTTFHSFVEDQHNLPLHHLVPLSSERRIQQYPKTPTTPASGRPTKSGIYEPYFTFPTVSADSGFDSISEENLSVSGDSDDEDYPATMTLERSSYSESISFGVVMPEPQATCLSVSIVQAEPRRRESVIFGPGLKPVRYQNNMIVFKDSTRKKYKSIVHYEPKIKPVGYSSTCFIRPHYMVQRFVSLVDYRTDVDRKWYQSKVELRPKTYSISKVQCFEMNNNEVDTDTEEQIYDDQDNSVFSDEAMDGLDSPYVVNAKVWDYSDATTAPKSFRDSLDSLQQPTKMHRTSIFVSGYDESSGSEKDLLYHGNYSDEYNGELPDTKHGDYLHNDQQSQQIQNREMFKGLDDYVHLNGYGGSTGSLEEIDI